MTKIRLQGKDADVFLWTLTMGLMPKVKVSNSKQKGKLPRLAFCQDWFLFRSIGIEPGLYALALNYSSKFLIFFLMSLFNGFQMTVQEHSSCIHQLKANVICWQIRC